MSQTGADLQNFSVVHWGKGVEHLRFVVGWQSNPDVQQKFVSQGHLVMLYWGREPWANRETQGRLPTYEGTWEKKKKKSKTVQLGMYRYHSTSFSCRCNKKTPTPQDVSVRVQA